ncbi:MAG TPA: M24 family metallopeptidase [Mycobacteriales bacterium]|jgi:Xaa-Pro aminopeptidase|nr:M24 family metallopeptidase [Mycobacteriales bacterium]
MTETEVRPDTAALRSARRARVLAEMEASGVDILIAGREPNARYIAGVPRLWINGSRPFGPGCVIERAGGSTHIVSTWDEGVPDDIPHENLHGITFNGANTLAWLTKVDGAATARKVATDGLMPSSLGLIRRAFPSAELVDGEQLMRRVRAVKLPEEIEAIRAAVRIAEHALGAAEAALVAGTTERELTGVFMERMAEAGITTPSTQDIAWVTSRSGPWSRSTRDASIAADDLVALDAGVIARGYVGEVGWPAAVGGVATVGAALRGTWEGLWEKLLAACRPGNPASRLLDAYGAAGVPVPPMPVARGLGNGNDVPLVTGSLPATATELRLEAGMVLAVTAYVWAEGVGGLYGKAPVVLTDSGPELLSTRPLREAGS